MRADENMQLRSKPPRAFPFGAVIRSGRLCHLNPGFAINQAGSYVNILITQDAIAFMRQDLKAMKDFSQGRDSKIIKE
jgi:hypothetical protein